MRREGSKECVIHFDVGEEDLKQCSNAFMGEVLIPGKSYFIQDEFIRQGAFSIKATPMGANLVLLEGGRDEDDFKGFIEEAKEWLF